MVRGKVVLVPFPFDDLSTTKVRPAICLTNPIGKYNHVILAFITSKISNESLDTDYILEFEKAKLLGLKVSSVIKLHKVVTLGTPYIKRELGVLTKEMMNEVKTRLKIMFEL